MAGEQTLAQRIKAKYPGVYDDMGDAELEGAINRKYPGVYQDVPHTTADPDDFTPRSFGGMVANAFEDVGDIADTLTSPSKWPGMFANAVEAKRETEDQMVGEITNPQPAAFSMPGDRLANELGSLPGMIADAVYERPVTSALTAVPGVGPTARTAAGAGRATVAAAGRAVQNPAVRAGAGMALDLATLGRVSAYRQARALEALGEAVNPKSGAPAVPTATSKVPAGVSPMAAGMREMGEMGAGRFRDLTASDRMVRGMSEAARTDPMSPNAGGRLTPGVVAPAPSVEQALIGVLDEVRTPQPSHAVAPTPAKVADPGSARRPATTERVTRTEAQLRTNEQNRAVNKNVERVEEKTRRAAKGSRRQSDLDAQAAAIQSVGIPDAPYGNVTLQRGMAGFRGLPEVSPAELARIQASMDAIMRRRSSP